jgi:multidrug efflux pump subunit AcrB
VRERLIGIERQHPENIYRHLEEGSSPEKAAEDGGAEVSMAVLAATLTACVVFSPVIFLYGVSKFLFTSLALAVVLSLFLSYFVAMTVIPLFCARYLRLHGGGAGSAQGPRAWFAGAKLHARFNRGFQWLLDTYEWAVRRTVRRPALTVACLLLVFVASLGMAPLLGVAFFPRTDAGQFTLNHISSFEYMDRVRRRIAADYPDLRTFFNSGSMVDAVLNMGMLAPIDVQVSSPDLRQAFHIATGLGDRIRALPGVSEAYIPQDMDYPAVRLDVDRVHAAELGLTPQDVLHNVITALDSNLMIAPNYWLDRKTGNDYFLTVQYYEDRRPAIHNFIDLRNIPVRAPNLPQATTLDTLVKLVKLVTPTEVDHYQIQRVIDIYVNPAGEDLGRITTGIRAILRQTKLPDGVRVDLRGMVQAMLASFQSFAMGLSLAIVLLYLILVAQFGSFKDPLLILLAIPMGFIGVLLVLPITHTTLNVMSLMGVLMLVGIAASNSILIVEFAHRLGNQGANVEDAVVGACRARLRPILMTSLATIIGLAPMAFKMGTGSEQYAPLARTIMGGLTTSVILTVFIVPAAYFLAYRRRERQA